MKIRLLPEVRIPLVDVKLPAIELPEFPPKPPELNERQIGLLRYAIMDDLGEVIPFVGDVLSDVAYAELKSRLTKDEYDRFVEENKWLPSTLALLKVFMDMQR
ncbi:MAG: hypothetical protein QW517_08095 [Thermofilaceae archaeon]